MRPRKFITLIGSAVTLPFVRAPVAEAQEPGRIYRLGVITGAPRQAPRNIALFDELKGLGFFEGQNLKIVVDGFGLRDEQFAEAAATLVKSAPDAIFSNRAVRAAQESTRTVPIVASDMLAAGFCALVRPSWRQCHRRQPCVRNQNCTQCNSNSCARCYGHKASNQPACPS
jgi:hypothetical protein